MSDAPYRWRLSSMLLAASGILLIGVGVYFLFLRPPLLPEDIRYMSLTSVELQLIGPRLTLWLTHVFRVMGGYVAATGVLALTLALTSFHHHRAAAAIGAGVAGGLSIGLMTAVNFMIHSDFKWVLLGMALVWGVSIVMFVREAVASPKAAEPAGSKHHRRAR